MVTKIHVPFYRGCLPSPSFQLASRSSTDLEARIIWEKEGYGKVSREVVLRRGDIDTGCGFYEWMQSDKRILYFGAGEYFLPHSSNEKETFYITLGSAHIWLWNEEKRSWNYQVKQKNEAIVIEPYTAYCLLAGEEGLSMYTSTHQKSLVRRYELPPPYPLPKLKF